MVTEIAWLLPGTSCTISVLNVISLSRVERWEKWRSLSNRLETWSRCSIPTAIAEKKAVDI